MGGLIRHKSLRLSYNSTCIDHRPTVPHALVAGAVARQSTLTAPACLERCTLPGPCARDGVRCCNFLDCYRSVTSHTVMCEGQRSYKNCIGGFFPSTVAAFEMGFNRETAARVQRPLTHLQALQTTIWPRINVEVVLRARFFYRGRGWSALGRPSMPPP